MKQRCLASTRASERAINMTGSVNVILVEDDPLTCAAFAAAVMDDEGLLLRAIAGSRAEGLALLAGTQADVLIVDLGLPDGSGLDVIQAASVCWPRCAVMVSTIFDDSATTLAAIEAGAVGYLLKDSSGRAITEEIRNVYNGGSPLSPLIARQLLSLLQTKPAKSMAGHCDVTLSEQQQNVLQLLARGFTAAEIASVKGVSQHTILTHIRRLYEKLAVNSRLEAIDKARKYSLLDQI